MESEVKKDSEQHTYFWHSFCAAVLAWLVVLLVAALTPKQEKQSMVSSFEIFLDICGVVIFTLFGMIIGIANDLARGILRGFIFGSIAIEIGATFVSENTVAAIFGLQIMILWVCLPAAVVFRKAMGLSTGVQLRVASATAGFLILTLVAIALYVRTYNSKSDIVVLTGSLMLWSCVCLFTALRPLAWVLAIPFVRNRRYRPFCRLIWIPEAGLRRRLQDELRYNWATGLSVIRQVLVFSLQFIPAVGAVKAALLESLPETCLSRVDQLVQDPYDWELVRYVSASLRNALAQNVVDHCCFYLPASVKRGLKKPFSTELCFDTPVQSACAAFWLWHRRDPKAAALAFSYVRHLPHGEELAHIAQAIVSAATATSLVDLASWNEETRWLDELEPPHLRPATLTALRELRSAAADATQAMNAASNLSRSTALGRSSSALQRFIDSLPKICPYPEWPNLQEAVEGWRRVVFRAGDEMAQELARRRLDNPYLGFSGLPIAGETFIGRWDILARIGNLWASESVLPTVFLYGHRRMGKTSILRHLDQLEGPETILVFLDMQDSSWVDHTGQFLLDVAAAIHKRTSALGFAAGAAPSADRYADLGRGRRALNVLLASIDSQMKDKRLILALDEFEYIEAAIEGGRIDRGLLPYLRALSQRHRWLALIFGGLHTLEEMGRDYRAVFWGQAEHVRVGYLTREDAFRLITQPHPEFDLRYTPRLRDELFRLTSGQPYLLQRLCWEIVERWNDRFLREGEKTPRTLDVEELSPILTDDLYVGTSYYFEGVWNNVSEKERTLMLTMARDKRLWSADALASSCGRDLLSLQDLQEILARLVQHDVATEENGGFRFSCELMRRWVAQARTREAS